MSVDARAALREALLRLWGIESLLSRRGGKPRARIVQSEFRVFEVKSQRWLSSGGWRLYFVKKKGVTTTLAASKLEKALRARRVCFAGLKDSWGTSYQYMALLEPEVCEKHVDLGDVEAWLVGESGFIPLGSHGGNIFKIALETDNPAGVCRGLEKLEHIPGYYGPQRFGIERPSSHIYGLRWAMREGGWLLREYGFRYPLEDPLSKRLGYESRAVERARREKSFWSSLNSLPRVAVDALQSYIFNRALSRVIEEEVLEEASEAVLTVRACGVEKKTPAARLPSRRLRESRSFWARVVREVCEEEGVDLRVFPARAPLRPLLFPVEARSCIAEGENRVVVAFCLSPSAYATLVLLEIAEIDFSSNYKN